MRTRLISSPTFAERIVIYRRKEGRMRCASPVGLLLVSVLVLAACGSPQKLTSYQEVATPITLTPKQIASIRAGVAKGFADRDLRAVNLGRMLEIGRASCRE